MADDNRQDNIFVASVLTLATCWHIKRKDSVVLGFTDHDHNLHVDGITYFANSGVKTSAIDKASGLSVESCNIEGILGHDKIKEEDLTGGLYDGAEVLVFMIDYTKGQNNKIVLKSGFLGEVHLNQNKFIAETRSLTQALRAQITQTYSSQCRANFCDKRCKLKMEDHTLLDFFINDVYESKSIFSCAEVMQKMHGNVTTQRLLSYGKVFFCSGENIGISSDIRKIEGNQISLARSTPHNLTRGDSFNISVGCDKTSQTCGNTYHNILNFRGEPHVPTSKPTQTTPE